MLVGLAVLVEVFDGSLQGVGRRFEQFGKATFVDRFFVGLLRRNPLFIQQILDGIVQRLHADCFACLHGRCNLKRLGVANEVRNR